MQRDDYIDYLKGILIFLVVLGHCYVIKSSEMWLAYRFHMPLFFMISGYLFNNKRSFKDFTIQKIKTIIVPYVIFFLISLFITELFMDKITLKQALIAFLLNGKHLIDVTNWAIWYLPTFFIVSLVFYPISKIKDKKILFIIMAITGLLTVPTYKYLIGIFPDECIPLSIQVLPAGICYMTLGYLYKDYKELINKKVPYKKQVIIAVILFILGFFISICTTKSEIIKLSTYRYLATSVLLIPLIILITKDNHNKIIVYLGKNSLIILGLHLWMRDLSKRYGVFDAIKNMGLSNKFIPLIMAIMIISIICILNEINIYLKKKVHH